GCRRWPGLARRQRRVVGGQRPHLLVREGAGDRRHDVVLPPPGGEVVQRLVEIPGALAGQPREGAARIARTLEPMTAQAIDALLTEDAAGCIEAALVDVPRLDLRRRGAAHAPEQVLAGAGEG